MRILTYIFVPTGLVCLALFTFATFQVLPAEKLGGYPGKLELAYGTKRSIRAIVKKEYHFPMAASGTVLLVADLNTGEINECARYPNEIITAAAADKNWENLIFAGFRLGEGGEFVRAVARGDDGFGSYNLIESDLKYGSLSSIIFDNEDGLFYIARASFAGQCRSMIDSYFIRGETGETTIYRYNPDCDRLDQIITVDSYLAFSDASSEDKLGVAYFPYPVSKSFGYIEKDSGQITGTWFLPPLVFPLGDLPFYFDRKTEKHPVCYYVIPGDNANFYPERGVVYVTYLNPDDDAKTRKLGDDVFTPVLYSDNSGALVFLETLYGAGETVNITAAFMETESEYSLELPPLGPGEDYKLLFVE